MQEEDVNGIHQVHTQAVSKVCSAFLTDEAVNAWLFGRTPQGYLVAANDHGESFWVAYDAKFGVIGYASWYEDELISLFVSPSFCGQGIGRQLFEACEADAKSKNFEIRRIKSTLNAQSFYEILGFREIKKGFDIKRGQRIPHVEMER